MRWSQGPAGGTAGRCELRSRESGVPGGEGGSGKRRARHLVLPAPPRLPPPLLGAAGGEEPCDQPAGRAAPLRSRCRPARICTLGQGLERETDKEGRELEQVNAGREEGERNDKCNP